MSNVLCDISGQYITWPSTNFQRNRIKTGFITLSIFLALLGQLTSHMIEIQAPPLDYQYAFVNKKGYYSKNVQGLFDHTCNL